MSEIDDMQMESEKETVSQQNGKTYRLRELSKFEKDSLDKAMQRGKEGIVKKQIVTGKEFKGDAFISKPAVIEFKDFDLGEPHTKTILLTNVSYSFNSFKLLPLAEEIRDYFEISYVPPGRMSAGMSCKITIKFTPQINQNIIDRFSVLAETGRIDIPLECTYKKSVVKVTEPLINFGKVIYGEDCTKKIILENIGALPTNIKIKNARGDTLKDRTETMSAYSRIHSVNQSQKRSNIDEDDNGSKGSQSQMDDFGAEEDIEEKKDVDILDQLKFNKSNRIAGYTTLEIPIKYEPKEIRKWSTTLTITFENFMDSPPIQIELVGECIDLPIYIEKPLYDMQICLMNHIYREKLIFYNRSNTAMKIQIAAPPETKKFFIFNPSFGYIQGENSLQIWLKLVLNKEIFNMCAKFMKKPNELIVPLKLIGAEQKLPVEFKVRVRITLDSFDIAPSLVDFDLMYDNMGKKVPVVFENKSELPQEIYFYPLPKAIVFQPFLIPIKIKPLEKFIVNFIYRAREIKNDENFIRAKIITGNISTREIKIPYKSMVYKAPLRFSSLKIDFPVLQINESCNEIINIRNISNKDYICEFFLPYYELCGLKLTPMVFNLYSGKSIEIIIEFFSFMKLLEAFTTAELDERYNNDPSHNFELRKQLKEQTQTNSEFDDAKAITDADKGGKKDAQKAAPPKADPKKGGKPTKQQEEEEIERLRLEEEDRLKLEEEAAKKQLLIDAFDEKSELAKLGGVFHEFKPGQQKHSQHYKWLIPCYFKPMKEPETSRSALFLEINTVSISKMLIADRDIIDFGEIAVGFRKVEELLITNKGENNADLRMDLLPFFGGFNVLNALRTIPPGKTRNIVIQFEPHNQQVFEETLRIYSSESSVSVKLRGTSVRPEVLLDPESGLLNVGACLKGENMENKFKIKNISNFSLNFKLATMAEGISNNQGIKAFSFSPTEGTILPGKEELVKVLFKPDRVSEKYYTLIKIDVPNQQNEKSLFIKGSCYDRQAYITYHEPFIFPKVEDITKPVEYPLDFIRIRDEETVLGLDSNKIILEFKKITEDSEPSELTHTRKLIVGNCKLLDPKMEKPVNYEIVLPGGENSSYFNCDNPRAAVTAGTQTTISFNFKPPEMDPFIENIEAFKGIGQWIQVEGTLKLSGGFIGDPSRDMVTMVLLLRAYINKI